MLKVKSKEYITSMALFYVKYKIFYVKKFESLKHEKSKKEMWNQKL